MKVKVGLSSPIWLFEIGAVIIKTETELVLESRWVVPEKLFEAGYTFKYAAIDVALKIILSNEQ